VIFDLVRANAALFFTPEETSAMDLLDRERNEIRRALEWFVAHDVRLAAELIYHSWYYYGVRGHYREAHEWLNRLVPYLPDFDILLRGKIETVLGLLSWAIGQYDEALTWLDRADCSLAEMGSDIDIAIALFSRGSVYRDRDEHAAARVSLDRALAMFEQLNAFAWMGYCLSVLGASARAEERYDEALALLERGLAVTRSIDYPNGMTPIVDHLGDIARQRGDHGAALDYYRETMRLWLKQRDPHGAADSLAGFAVVLGTLGDFDTSAHLLASAESTYRQLGLPPSRYGPPLQSGAVDGLRQALGERFDSVWAAGAREPIFRAMAWAVDYQPMTTTHRQTPPATATWHDAYGLTAREIEILDLLSEGYSNAEIGERLYISGRTAGTHVSNIFGKIGVNSRAAAVAFAERAKHRPT
jgi:ATP/maltotriose-dependent transcriptional regulator MalT